MNPTCCTLDCAMPAVAQIEDYSEPRAYPFCDGHLPEALARRLRDHVFITLRSLVHR